MKMKMNNTNQNLIDCFSKIDDPRIERSKRHQLIDIFVIAICAVICGAKGWEDMETFGKAKYEWLKTFLELPNGIPGDDTYRRIFARISSNEFRNSFFEWIESISKITDGDIVPIDGKTLRHSDDKAIGKNAIHMVSAWSTQNQMVLGQIKTEDKSNEIKAIPKLLNLLDIAGCIVTIDAMGCQKDITKKIIEKRADYVIALKGNQGSLLEDVSLFLDAAKNNKFADIEHDFYQTTEKGHGRIETRKYWITNQINWLNERHPTWTNLKAIGLVESTRKIGNKISTELRYYIASINPNAKIFAKAVRNHWGIENSLHWVLDIAFREDECSIRTDNAPQNFAVLRHIALNLLKNEISFKRGLRAKGFRASMDNKYLDKILFS